MTTLAEMLATKGSVEHCGFCAGRSCADGRDSRTDGDRTCVAAGVRGLELVAMGIGEIMKDYERGSVRKSGCYLAGLCNQGMRGIKIRHEVAQCLPGGCRGNIAAGPRLGARAEHQCLANPR